MPWKTDAFEDETDAPAHFHVENRQGDWQAALAVNDVVQEAILGIVVIVAIAAKTLLLEQDIVERGNGAESIGVGAASLADFDGKFIDAPEISGDVEIGIVGERYGQRGAAEIDAFFRPFDGLTKFSVRIGNQCVVSWGFVLGCKSPGKLAKLLFTTKITKNTKFSEI